MHRRVNKNIHEILTTMIFHLKKNKSLLYRTKFDNPKTPFYKTVHKKLVKDIFQ